MKKQLQQTMFLALLGGLFSYTAASASLSGKVVGPRGVSVVYVEAIAGKTFPASGERMVIDQRGMSFQPHVAALPVGSTVEFLNSDKVAHNIFWPAVGSNKSLKHNLGTWPAGQKREFKFDTPGVVPLLCNVHPEMSGYLVITPTPYFAVTDADGNYKIANLPDGQYNVAAWHEGGKPLAKPVKVAGDSTAEFTLAK